MKEGMTMLRMAVIGSGAMGKIHAGIINATGRAKVEYVFDTVEESAKVLADEVGAESITDMEELCKKEIDLAFVCVPNKLHAKVAIEILNAGIAVFSEKPMATGIKDAEAMVEAAKQSGVRLFVGHNRRFAPVYLEAKNSVKAEDYMPHNINIIQNDGDMGGEGSIWAADFKNLGGFLYDTTIHFLDMAEYLMGEIETVSALGKSACYDVEDDFVIQLKFKDGGLGAITTCGHASWIFPFERVQVVGDHKSVITEELDSYRYCPGLSKTIKAYDYSKLEFEKKWGYYDMHLHMYDALEHKMPALNDGEIGLRAVKLVEACHESMEKGGVACTVHE